MVITVANDNRVYGYIITSNKGSFDNAPLYVSEKPLHTGGIIKADGVYYRIEEFATSTGTVYPVLYVIEVSVSEVKLVV